MSSHDCRVSGSIKIRHGVTDEAIKSTLETFLAEHNLDYDELVADGIEFDGAVLHLGINILGYGGYQNDSLDALTESLASITDECGFIELLDFDTGNSDVACTPYFIGADAASKQKAQLLYGIDQAEPWLRPVIGNEAFDALTRQVLNPPSASRADRLAELKAEGLTIGECITAFAVPSDDLYVKRARSLILGADDIEIDDSTTISASEDGAWVLNWLWVSNEEAGILSNSELLEKVLDHARLALADKHGLDAEAEKLRDDQADWLEDLITNYADELDGIENEVLKGIPGPIHWLNGEGVTVRFMPSDALNQLRLLARLGGLPDDQADQAEKFCIRYGNKLDAILTAVQTA